jgi:hypothetical protein
MAEPVLDPNGRPRPAQCQFLREYHDRRIPIKYQARFGGGIPEWYTRFAGLCKLNI